MSNIYKYNALEDTFDIVFDDTVGASKTDLNNAQADIVSNQNNIIMNSFKVASVGDLAIFKGDNMTIDEYITDAGLDLGSSVDVFYDSIDGYITNLEPLDSFTKLILHCGGTDEATSFPDASASGHIVTANGNAQVDTAISKFGTGSALFGFGDWLSVANSTEFDFGTGDFTIDWWEYRFSGGSGQGVSIARSADKPGALAFVFGYDDNIIRMASQTGYVDIVTGTLGTRSLDEWVHYAVVRSGTTFYSFKNGVQSDTWTSALALAPDTSPLSIGAFDVGSGNARHMNGHIEEVRISKGIARWTTTFIPPIRAYGGALNSTLISATQVVDTIPTSTRIVLLEEDVDAVTLNTDLKAWGSRDGGSTWVQGTLTEEEDLGSNKRILSASFDLTASGIGSGVNLRYKYETFNSKSLNLHATSLIWK